jgi:hypothetical protein
MCNADGKHSSNGGARSCYIEKKKVRRITQNKTKGGVVGQRMNDCSRIAQYKLFIDGFKLSVEESEVISHLMSHWRNQTKPIIT